MSSQQISILAVILKTFHDFCDNTSLNGFRVLYTKRNYKLLIYLWSLMLVAVISFSAFVLLSLWNNFTRNPFLTTLEKDEFEIWDTSFPAVGICSVNKLSAKAAIEYSKGLFNKSHGALPENKILENIRYFAALLDTKAFDPDEALEVQNFMDKYDSLNYYDYFDVKKAMHLLAPKCQDLLRKCRWNGVEMLCKDLFQLLATPSGFCCVFNYLRNQSDPKNNYLNEIRKPQAVGMKHGLTVLLNASTADYFYSDRSTSGFVVQIFQSLHFPDIANGGVSEILVSPLEDISLNMNVDNYKSESRIRSYSVTKRQCYFEDEHSELFDDNYSLSQCLTNCKLRSIEALCNCIPFYTPANFIEKNETSVYCSLANIECLDRYRVTWNTYRPLDGTKGLEKEMEDSLNCPDCYPLCTGFKYNYHLAATTMFLYETLLSTDEFLLNETDLNNTALVNVYFGKQDGVLYRRDVLYKWYEILAYYGGLLGICFGASFISFVEILYFATVRLYENYQMYKTTNVDKRRQ